MSINIKKVYSDNPYVDEMVYYTMLLGLDTVLKLSDRADKYETLDTLKKAGTYMACVEGTAVLRSFSEFPFNPADIAAGKGSPLTSTLDADGRPYGAGLSPVTAKEISMFPERVFKLSKEKQQAVLDAMVIYYQENYVEQNFYYRMLNGLPPLDEQGNEIDLYVEDWRLPADSGIDTSIPIHKMDKGAVTILEDLGILEDLFKAASETERKNREYLFHLGNKKIPVYLARKARPFEPLYIPSIKSAAIREMYMERLANNRTYTMKTVYSKAYQYDSDYYDNIMAVFIIVITLIDIISRVQEFITRKEIFDIRSCQYLFESYGVDFFDEIPLKYQIAMVKNIHTLLKNKSTARCMVEICSLFGFSNIKVFKYYLLKDRNMNFASGEYSFTGDDEKDFTLKFIKLPLEDDIDDYIRNSANHIDYDELTDSDPTWDGGLDHKKVKQDILKEAFNIVRTKYISIDTIYDIAKMSMQQTYFFNMLYDNYEMEENLKLRLPFIDGAKQFRIADIFCLLTALSYYYNGIKDCMMDSQEKVLYIDGFDFKDDFGVLAAEIERKNVVFHADYENEVLYINGFNGDEDINEVTKIIEKYGYTSHESTKDKELKVNGFNFRADMDDLKASLDKTGYTLHAMEQLKKFEIPQSQIPSLDQMMAMYANNLDVRDELVKGMQESDNLRVFLVYRKLYNSLMTVQLTMDFFKNPETGDLYRDDEGDPTYTEYFKHKEPLFYHLLTESKLIDDDDERKQFISTQIDNIVAVLENYIDLDEYQSLLSNLPAVSAEAVKKYIAEVINFYKSYKVDFLGLNTIYYLDDKNEGIIRLIDDLRLERNFTKNEVVKLYELIAKMSVHMTYDEKIRWLETLYLDIFTWARKQYDEYINVYDDIPDKIVRLVKYTVVMIAEELVGFHINMDKLEFMSVNDFIKMDVSMSHNDKVSITDKVWLTTTQSGN